MITTDVGRGHFYVTTQDPFGKWSDPHWLPTIGGIDPSFFFDDDGKAYIVHKEDTEGKPKWSNFRSIRITRFDTATFSVKTCLSANRGSDRKNGSTATKARISIK